MGFSRKGARVLKTLGSGFPNLLIFNGKDVRLWVYLNHMVSARFGEGPTPASSCGGGGMGSGGRFCGTCLAHPRKFLFLSFHP